MVLIPRRKESGRKENPEKIDDLKTSDPQKSWITKHPDKEMTVGHLISDKSIEVKVSNLSIARGSPRVSP